MPLAQPHQPTDQLLHVGRLGGELARGALRRHVIRLHQDGLPPQPLATDLAHPHDAEELPPIYRTAAFGVCERERRLLPPSIKPQHLTGAPVAGIGACEDSLSCAAVPVQGRQAARIEMLSPPPKVSPEGRGDRELAPPATTRLHLSSLPIDQEALELVQHALHVGAASRHHLRDKD